MTKLEEGDARPECCRDEDNLELVSEDEGPDATLKTFECSECGRRHYRAEADPKVVGLKGASL